jgi:phosphoribosylanthranilate isomerase
MAAETVKSLPAAVEKIGVFVNERPDRMAEIAREVGLTGVQLHGDESASELREYRRMLGGIRLIKTLQAREFLAVGGEEQLETYLDAHGDVDAILLDSGRTDQRGGTGVPFDWQSALPIVRRIKAALPVIIAGGLTADNVGEVIRLFEPWGVDVVSGVEREPGRKHDVKLRSFVTAVRNSCAGVSAGG